MQIEIRHLNPTHVVGLNLEMCLAANRTPELWKRFMPLRNTLISANANRLFSIQVYNKAGDVKDVNAVFVKWAALEVPATSEVPKDMEALTIAAGDYAVFHYAGGPQGASDFFSMGVF
jgi:AraC family transcriptional regulator